MALYGAHLPLDLHPKYGNNALISRALGLKSVRPFGEYHGSRIAVVGCIPGGMSYSAFRKRAEKAMGRELKEMHFGGEVVRKVAVVSGGGCSLIPEAHEIGADMFLCGEPTLSGRNFLSDAGMNGLFGGHYVTERFGVEAMGRVLEKRFGVPAEFVDLGIKD
jgi:putative NIF3 family GTP cyclohydrolase 1 type 2